LGVLFLCRKGGDDILKNKYRKKGVRLNDFEYLAVAAFVMLLLIYSKTRKAELLYYSALVAGIAILPLLIKQICRQRKRRKYLGSGINTVDKMSGEEFEEFLLCHFKKLGYSGRATPVTGDYGAD
jgi:restriction system protein